MYFSNLFYLFGDDHIQTWGTLKNPVGLDFLKPLS